MDRIVELYFCDFDNHLSLPVFDLDGIIVRQTSKGDPTPSGKGKLPYNVINISYSGSDLPDEYDARINLLLDAIGEKTVRDLVTMYRARISDICLGMLLDMESMFALHRLPRHQHLWRS